MAKWMAKHYMAMKIISLLLLTFILVVPQLPAQVADNSRGFAEKDSHISYAPISLFTSGAGRIVPYEFDNGQMLRVGHQYLIFAIPDRGYVFSNWARVDILTDEVTRYDEYGNPYQFILNQLVTPEPTNHRNPLLGFTMQPEMPVANGSEFVTTTLSIGWQANFVPAKSKRF
jgi:hypothetical protein